ncbi:MAG: hypothetical protein ACFE9Z_10515 [Promethearchaeota archaeon]
MSTYLKEFNFEKPPVKITYFEKEFLKLNSEFIFFHNKSKFRKELTKLQVLFKSYTNTPLHAAGIRDSYLDDEYFEKYLIVLFTDSKQMKKVNKIVEKHSDIEINPGCFFLINTSDFMLLLSEDVEGIKSGIDTMEIILKQILEDYMNQKRFDDYIKICSFELLDCSKR